LDRLVGDGIATIIQRFRDEEGTIQARCLHRDIDPANIILPGNASPVLVDLNGRLTPASQRSSTSADTACELAHAIKGFTRP
jgi:hypothetical protein